MSEVKKTSKARKIFGDNLLRFRKQKAMSQEELGFKSGLHRTYIGSVERGSQNVSVDNIYKLAAGLGVEPTVFFEKQLDQ